MLVSEPITKAKTILLDENFTRWTEAELLGYYNDGVRQTVMLRPDAYVVPYDHTCTASSRQELNVLDYRLIEILNNKNGGPVSRISKTVLDVTIPEWQKPPTTGSDVVEFYTYDERFPKYFHVYPVPKAGVKLELMSSRLPAAATSGSSTTTLNDIYSNAIVDYMLHRAFLKESKDGSTNKADYHYNQFLNQIGVKTQTDKSVSPSIPFTGRGYA